MRPLVVLPEGLIVYIAGSIYKVDHKLNTSRFICRLPMNIFPGLLANHWRLIERVFRSSPSHAIVFDNALFIARRSEIWRCDLNDGRLSLDFHIPDSRRSLGFSLIPQVNGMTTLVFGEYFSNQKRQPVRIWGRKPGKAIWNPLAEFPQGEIEHVHAVSSIGGIVYVLTGDFDQAAGIWITDANFNALRPLVRGQQAYRSAWMEAMNGRIFMATDTQLEANKIFDFESDNNTEISLKKIATLDGSSIYSGRGPAEIFFSTTVECGEPTGGFVRDLFDTRPGPGMLSHKANLMSVDSHGFVTKIYSAEKDAWPFRLAQFGTFIFPNGAMPTDTLFAFGVAVKGVDGTCMIFRRSNE